MIFGVLFGPIIGAIVTAIAVPFALFKPPAGWVFVGLMVLDYVVPLRRRPWAWYHDIAITQLVRSFRSYVPCKLCIDPEFKICQDRRYLVCAHPHGIFGFYIVFIMELLLGQGVRMTSFAASILTQLPFARRHFSWMGIASADAKSMRACMQRKFPANVCYSTPGGIEEAFCVPNEQIVVLKRKGFCKIALQCGTDLVPTYGFGNNQFFPVLSGQDSRLAKVSKKLNVTIMLWIGLFNIPYSCLPMKHPQLLAVGAPIRVEMCPNPSQEQIDELHTKYCTAIRLLFDKYRTDPMLEKTGFAKKVLHFDDEGRKK